MHFVYAGSLLLAPLSYAELSLGIPIKNCNDQKIESARGKMGGEEKTSLLLFSLHVFPAHFSFFPLPNLPPPPTTQRSLRRKDCEQSEHEMVIQRQFLEGRCNGT